MAWDFLDYIPGVNSAKALVEGDYRKAAKNFATGGQYGVVDGISGGRADEIADYIPGVNTGNDIIDGNWGDAVKNLATGGLYGPVAGGVGAVKNAAGKIGDAVNAPYDQKREGIESIQQRLEALKKERMARMDQVYGKADAKYDDSRAAMAQLYGAPSGWKL